HGGLAVIRHRTPMLRKFPKASQQRSIRKRLKYVIDVARDVQRKSLAGLCVHLHPDPIPGIAPVAGMSFGRPARNVPLPAGDGVKRAGLGNKIDRFPGRVVEAGIGPLRVVADVELPRTVQRNHRLAHRDGCCGLRRGRVLSVQSETGEQKEQEEWNCLFHARASSKTAVRVIETIEMSSCCPNFCAAEAISTALTGPASSA